MTEDEMQLTSNGIVKGLLGKMASLIRRVEDLVVEDGEVQGQAQPDRVSRGQVGLGDLGGVLVGLERLLGRLPTLIADGELGQITMVVALPRCQNTESAEAVLGSSPRPVERGTIWGANAHLVIEDLALTALGRGDQVLVKHVEDILANLGEFGLDLLAIVLDEGNLRVVALGLLLLFDRGDNSPGGTPGADDVLVGDRQEIPLFDREFLVGRGDVLHVLHHL